MRWNQFPITHLVAHLHFSCRTRPDKNAKELPSQRTKTIHNRQAEGSPFYATIKSKGLKISYSSSHSC